MSKAVYYTLTIVAITIIVVVILGVYLVTGHLLAVGYACLISLFIICVFLGYYYYRKSHCTLEINVEVVGVDKERGAGNFFVKVSYKYEGGLFEKVLVATEKQSKLMASGGLLKTGDKIPVMINPKNPKDIIFAPRNMVANDWV